MHLNAEYEAIRGHILLLDHLPTMNKPYYMIQMVEKQRRVTYTARTSREVAAYVNKIGTSSIGEFDAVNALISRNKNKKDTKKPKYNKIYDHCQRPSHEKDQCFKLIRYPEWYDGLK